MSDVVVIGAGIAGQLAAARLVERGATVTVVAFGIGGLPLATGGFDVLGYAPDRVRRPFAALDSFAAAHPDHPYAILGADAVRAGADAAQAFFGADRLVGRDDENWLLPTAIGGCRPTYLCPPTMVAGDLSDAPRRLVVIGLRWLKDFPAALVAGNLGRTLPGVAIRSAVCDVRARDGEVDSSALTYARALDDPRYRAAFAAALRPLVHDGETVLLPAVAGLKDPGVLAELSERVGAPLAEVSLPPPSVPGMRLDEFAAHTLKRGGVRWIAGSRVVAIHGADGVAASVEVATSGHPTTLRAGAFVFAPGGFESGALALDSRGTVTETALGLPVVVPDGELITADRHAEQPLFRAGLAIDPDARVLAGDGSPVYANLFAAGGVLAGAQRWLELSGDGIAAASAVRAADVIGGAA